MTGHSRVASASVVVWAPRLLPVFPQPPRLGSTLCFFELTKWTPRGQTPGAGGQGAALCALPSQEPTPGL